MTPSELVKLIKLSQAQQNADAAILNSVRAEERRIRAQIADIDSTQKSARDLPAAETLPQRCVGGDLIWQRWVGRRRRELQMQLARCLARKGKARHHLQKSFGKTAALQSVRFDTQTHEDHAKNTQILAAVTEIGVLRQSR